MTPKKLSEKTPEKIYRIHVNVDPIYYYVDLPCKNRAEAKWYAKQMAVHPFEGVRLKDYVSYELEELKPAPRVGTSKRR